MKDFAVGQKWATRSGDVVKAVYVNKLSAVFEKKDGCLFTVNANGYRLPSGEGPHDLDVLTQVVEPKYRPFANAAEFDAYRDKWILSKTGNNRCHVVSYTDSRVGLYLDWLLWKNAFESYTFEDGQPFGIEVAS